MTAGHPAKGQWQEQTSQPDKTDYAVARKKNPIFLFFVITVFLWLCDYVSKRRAGEAGKNQCPQFGRETAIPSEAKINCRTERVVTVQWSIPNNSEPVVTASGVKFFSPHRHSAGEDIGMI